MIFIIFIIEESCRDRHCDARLELVVAASSTYVFREFTLVRFGLLKSKIAAAQL